MANDPLLYFDAPWFDPNKVPRFPIAGYADHDGVLPEPLPTGHIKYFELQRPGAYFLGVRLGSGVAGFEASGVLALIFYCRGDV